MGSGREASDASHTPPRYLGIGYELRQRIRSGDLTAGQRLAGERQLAREFGVSPVTMSRALAELARQGVVACIPGAGTFVSDTTSSGDLAVIPMRQSFEDGHAGIPRAFRITVRPDARGFASGSSSADGRALRENHGIGSRAPSSCSPMAAAAPAPTPSTGLYGPRATRRIG